MIGIVICTAPIRFYCWTFALAPGNADRVVALLPPTNARAGYLAQAFNNVHLDIGLSVNHLGARAATFIGRTLELAPFRKILYSSDAFGPPELHYLGARLWRTAIAEVLSGFVDRAEWSTDNALRVAGLIGRGNAERVYRLSG